MNPVSPKSNSGWKDPLAVAGVGGSFKPSLGRDDVRAPVAVDVSRADAVPVAPGADHVPDPVRVLALAYDFVPGQREFAVAELRQELLRLAGVQDIHQKREFHRRARLDDVLHPGLVRFAGVFPPGQGRAPVGTGHHIGIAVAIHVNRQVAQVFQVTAGEGQVAKMVLDPTRPILARRRLLVPVLAGNDVEPPVEIHIGHLCRFAYVPGQWCVYRKEFPPSPARSRVRKSRTGRTRGPGMRRKD